MVRLASSRRDHAVLGQPLDQVAQVERAFVAGRRRMRAAETALMDAIRFWGLNTRSHLGAGRPQRVWMVWARSASAGRFGPARRALGQHHGVALARRLEGPDRIGAEGGGDLLQAALVARRAAEQVDRHAAVLGQQRAAVGIEVLAVEHRRGGLVVVQVDLQRVDRAQPVRLADLGGGIGQDHLELAVVGRQLEPAAAGRHHLRIELDRGGAHAQRLAAELGERWPRPGPAASHGGCGTLAASTNSSQAIMRCTYSSSISKGASSFIEPWTHSVPRCR